MNYSIVFQNDDFYIVDKGPFVESFEIADDINNDYDVDRNGLVHRLDKDTSGLMIFAKNNNSLIDLQKLFKSRIINKSYYGLVWGKIESKGIIELNIARDPKRKKPMKVVSYQSQSTRGVVRFSKTSWKVNKYYNFKNNTLSLVEFKIFTGRTHQIRLTAHYLHHPIIGDKIYYFKDSRKFSETIKAERQFLHCYNIEFIYKEIKYNFTSELPSDLRIILSKLDSAIEK